jgi:peptidoglycan/LPS O-acetylase OafA/YrhL
MPAQLHLGRLSDFTKLGPGAFRLILALAVVLHHCTRFFPFGTVAVYVFFILSGYWVTRMWEERYSTSQNAYSLFVLSRSLRIFPLYWIWNAPILDPAVMRVRVG